MKKDEMAHVVGGNKFLWDMDKEEAKKYSSDDVQTTVKQPSPEEIYNRHFLELEEEVKGVKQIIDNAFNSNENLKDQVETIDISLRQSAEEIKKLDEDNLKRRRKSFDDEDRVIFEDKMTVATKEEEEEMNRMAYELYGVKVEDEHGTVENDKAHSVQQGA